MHVLAGGIVRVAEHENARALAHSVEEVAALDRDLDAYFARFPSVEPVAAATARNYSYAQGLVAGEASAELVDAILRDVDMSADAKRAFADDFTWWIPRVVKA